jgi:chromosome segregation ATPase
MLKLNLSFTSLLEPGPELTPPAWALSSRPALGASPSLTLQCPAVSDAQAESLRARVTRQGEEAIGKLAQELLENPVVSSAIAAAFETRERAMKAQEAALGALNLPSAADLERLTRRLRSVSQRLEAIEDGLDGVQQRLQDIGSGEVERRLEAIEQALGRIEAQLAQR